MAQLSIPNKLQKAGYKGVKVTSQIQAIKHSSIFPHLRLVQQNEICKLKNKYKKTGYLNKKEMAYVWCIYWNFVLNDFRYEKSKK